MAKFPKEAPFLSNIGFMLTYRCTIACPHCIVEAGPHRTEEMLLENANQWIQQAAAYRGGHIRGLALTGGEPFYNREMLAKVSGLGRSLSRFVSVVTNAFWASSTDTALEVLASLPAIQLISISTDIYHQRAVPFSYVLNAIHACETLKRGFNLAVCTDNEQDTGYLRVMEDIRQAGYEDSVSRSITFPVGRAQRRMKNFHYQMVASPTVAACSMAGSPVIFSDGRVIACIGPVFTLPREHPLYLGNMFEEPLEQILDRAEVNPILHALRIWGPHRLVRLLQENGFGSLPPGEYIDKCICDTCYKLFSNPEINNALMEIFEKEELEQIIAYGRVYYLQETVMAERLGLAQNS